MTDEDRRNFRRAAIEYLRDPDAVTDARVQARIAFELEQLAKEVEYWKKRWIRSKGSNK